MSQAASDVCRLTPGLPHARCARRPRYPSEGRGRGLHAVCYGMQPRRLNVIRDHTLRFLLNALYPSRR